MPLQLFPNLIIHRLVEKTASLVVYIIGLTDLLPWGKQGAQSVYTPTHLNPLEHSLTKNSEIKRTWRVLLMTGVTEPLPARHEAQHAEAPGAAGAGDRRHLPARHGEVEPLLRSKGELSMLKNAI
jgi:hypothetical protein